MKAQNIPNYNEIIKRDSLKKLRFNMRQLGKIFLTKHHESPHELSAD